MRLSFDQAMMVLAGLAAGCDRSTPDIVPETPQQTAAGVSSVPEAAQNSDSQANPPKASPTGSTVVVKEITRPPSPRPGAPASSAKEKGCAPGGCAPGKCG